MRTKTLLCAAVLAAGVVTSMAQVYSQNIVGYCNVQLQGNNKFDFVSIPLKPSNGDFKIANTMTLTDDAAGTYILTWNGTAWDNVSPQWFAGYGWYAVDGDGNPVDVTITNGQAFFISSPIATTITFVGEVNKGDLGQCWAPGFNAVGNKVPAAENFPGATVGVAGDILLPWGGEAWADETFQFFDGYGWFSGGANDNVNGAPLGIGKGLFYENLNPGTLCWTRTFNP